jgi:hypothetical protein
MATYDNDLRLKEITTGDEDGQWGVSTNTNLALIADGFSLGTKQMAADANETFTMPDATADATRSLYLKITSAVSLTATREVTLGPNTVSKTWIIENATSGSQIITIKQGSGATVNVPNGSKVMVVTDGAGAGAAVFNANPTEVGGTVTSIDVSGGTTGLTTSGGPVTTSGTITLAGTLAVANGGTGSTTAAGALINFGLTATAAELNYTDGVTSNIQTQLDTKAPTASPTFTGTVTIPAATVTGDVSFGDNDKAQFGAGNDLQIYHTGTQSYVSDQGTGNLNLLGDARVVIGKADGTENMAQFFADAQVELYYDNVSKLATTASGIEVNDAVVAMSHTGNTSTISFTQKEGTQNSVATITANREDVSTSASRLLFSTNNGTSTLERMRIAFNGDISFYEDTGTTPKFFWDASAESLGIGTSSPSATLQVGALTSGSTGNAVINHEGGSTPALQVKTRTNRSTLQISDNDTTGYLSAENGLFSIGRTAGLSANNINIDSSNNVGIGTSSPAYLFTLKDSDGADLAFSNSTASPSAGDYLGRIYAIDNGDNFFAGINMFYHDADDGEIRFRIKTAGTNTDVMTLVDGEVGIGTTSPAAKIDVVSSGANLGRFAATNGYIDLVDSSVTGRLQVSGNVFNMGTTASGDMLAFKTGANTERMRIDSSGNVGIGTSSVLMGLHFAKSSGNAVYGGLDGNASGFILRGNIYYDTANARLQPIVTGYQTEIDLQNNDGSIRLLTSTSSVAAGSAATITERMRIDSIGNLLVGQTSGSSTNTGHIFAPTGVAFHVRDGGVPLVVDRLTSDGDIVYFRKDGTVVGSIGARGGDVYLETGDTGIRMYDQSDAIIPVGSAGVSRDAAIDLGLAPNIRFKDLYLSGGVYLGGTVAANKLDDYEEGTYTAAITCGTSGTVTLQAAFDTAAYTKIGDLVSVQGLLIVDSVSSPVGYFAISLPFGPKSLTDRAGDSSGSIFIDYSTANVRDFCMFVSEVDGAFAYVFLGDSTSRQSDSANALTAGTQISFQISYKAA